jgi:hypothetical protein
MDPDEQAHLEEMSADPHHEVYDTEHHPEESDDEEDEHHHEDDEVSGIASARLRPPQMRGLRRASGRLHSIWSTMRTLMRNTMPRRPPPRQPKMSTPLLWTSSTCEEPINLSHCCCCAYPLASSPTNCFVYADVSCMLMAILAGSQGADDDNHEDDDQQDDGDAHIEDAQEEEHRDDEEQHDEHPDTGHPDEDEHHEDEYPDVAVPTTHGGPTMGECSHCERFPSFKPQVIWTV